MEPNATKDDLPTVMRIVAPLLALAVLSGVIILVVFLSDSIEFVSPSALFISCAIVYAATIFFLSRASIAKVRKLEELSLTDGLSGLPNRRALHSDIEELDGNAKEVALALVDLDGFKQVNDHFGHDVGDKLIVKCAGILRGLCQTDARCYRLGGDEFAIVMVDPLAGTILEGMCRNLINRLEKPIVIGSREITVGASIGLSRSTQPDLKSSSELLRQSDVAMYESKRAGKMRCTWFSANFDKQRELSKELDDKIREALRVQEFSIEYQPLLCADTREIVAVEALVRWKDKSGHSVPADKFVPAAEESGLIKPLGLWVLRQACQDALNWQGIALSVNISATQLRNPEFKIKLGQVLEETGFPAERLELEITETSLIADPKLAHRSLDMLRGFGIKFSLDDFGTGFASVGFLRQFHFQKLKLDRTMVVGACEDESTRAMLISSVTVARALKMEVTAEGVETEQQAELARTAGCDHLQGWLFYKSMPAKQIDLLLTPDEPATKQSA